VLRTGTGQSSNRRSYCTNNYHNLNPKFVTGFTDGEGSFIIRVIKSSGYRLGWTVQPIFQIELHKKDENILKFVQSYLGVGNIYSSGTRSSLAYKVTSVKDLVSVINHFDKYPLITNKQADYLLFKKVVGMIQLKEHLTLDGLNKMVAIKASLNRGLSDELKAAFPHVIPVKRPIVTPLAGSGVKKICFDPEWLAGFTSAEGCFPLA